MLNLAPPPGCDALAVIAASPGLPAPPPAALAVIEQASRPDCELEDVARIIERDDDLCEQVLRAVNSAIFGLQRPIDSVGRALQYLGLKPVRALVLSLSLPAMRLSNGGDVRLRDWWTASVAAAIVARELAVRLGRPDADDDMASALLCDLGVFVLQRVFPAEYAAVLAQPAAVLARRHCELERQAVGVDHAEVSAFLLARWGLPPDLTEPIRRHHQPSDARGRLLYLAARLAQFQTAADDPAALLREVLRLACDGFGLSEAGFVEFLGPLDRKIDEFVAVLRFDVIGLASYPTLVANAAAELAEQAEGADDADPEVLRWRRVAQRLRSEATRDRLTGAFNRPYFEEALAREFRRARRRCTALGLLAVELVGYAELGERFGKGFADQALKEVAAALRRGVRADDVVARRGGAEFCVLAVDTTPEGLPAMAKRVWHAVNGLLVRHDGVVAPVAVSVGATVCVPYRTRQTTADLPAASGRALGAARDLGADRLQFLSLVSDDDMEFLRQVRQGLFSTFLVAREVVTAHQVRAALRSAPPPPVLVGRLARRLGWVTPRRWRRVLRDQRKHRRTFGESALALRYLRPEQVEALTALRREPPEALAAGLVDVEALTEEQAQEQVAAFYEALTELS